MSNPPPNPSVIGLAILGARIVSSALTRLVTAPFRSRGPLGLYKDVFFAAIREMLSNITIPQSRYIFGTTTDVYRDFCTQQHLAENTVQVGGVASHWIGREDADVIILYFHGGGYTQPLSIGYMEYLNRLVIDMNSLSDGLSISVLVPAYTLAPEAVFPTQLKQVAAVLLYLLVDCNRSPSSIILGGDSAGGNLVLSLLSHIRHPCPDVPEILLRTPLAGTVLFSPWVSFDTSHKSFLRNAQTDALIASNLRKWSSMYLGTNIREEDPGVVTGGNEYSEPLQADSPWWKGMADVAGDVFLYGGEDEVFIDGLKEFARRFQEGWATVDGGKHELHVEFVKNDAHIGPIMDVMLQYKEKSEAQLAVELWLKERLVLN